MSCELVPSDGGGQVRGEVEGKGEGKYEIRGEVEGKGEGKYEISYHPQHRGRHQLYIRVEDTHISGSPFTVAVLTTNPTSSITGLSVPRGLAVNARGQVVVAQCVGQLISIFSANGDWVASFGSGGSAPGQLSNPEGIAITATGDILVSDIHIHKTHNVLFEYGTGRIGHVEWWHPVAVDPVAALLEA